MINVAIIGVTGYGRTHFIACQQLIEMGRIALKAAVVVNPADAGPQLEVMKAVGCRVFGSPSEMWSEFAGKIDLCIIPAPIQFHRPFAIEAMRSGANVLVEKPMAGCMEDAIAMRDAEAETGRFIVVGFQDIFDPCSHAAKRMLLAGEIGEVKRISGFGLWPRALSYYRRNDWAGRMLLKSGWVKDSPFNNAMAHFLSMELFLGGKELNAMARISSLEGCLFRANDIESFDTGALRLLTPEGIEIFYAGSHACRETHNPIIRIEGDRGYMEWAVFHWLRIYRDNEIMEELVPMEQHDLRLRVVDQSLRRLDFSHSTLCDSRMAMAHVELIEHLHDHVEIHTISAEHYADHETKDGFLRAVKGIEAHTMEAALGCKLFSEMSLPWVSVATTTTSP